MASRPAATGHPNQLLTLGISAVYTLVGLLGLVVTGSGDFAAETYKTRLALSWTCSTTWCGGRLLAGRSAIGEAPGGAARP
jgi:hypothetical protein